MMRCWVKIRTYNLLDNEWMCFVLFHKQSKVTITLKFIDFQEDIEKKIRTDITDIEKKLATNKPADNSG